MRIGIISAGWMGGSIGRALLGGGHQVLFSSRHPERATALADQLGAGAFGGTVEEAAAFGEAVVFAVPYTALPALAHDLEETLAGKIVLDACNPYPPDSSDFVREVQDAGVAQFTAGLLPGVRLVRAFSSVDATQVEASANGERAPLAVPIASDDPEALRIVQQLVRDAGCEPLITGKLESARGFQRGGPGFRVHTDVARLRALLGVPVVA